MRFPLGLLLVLVACASPRVYQYPELSKSILVAKTGRPTLVSDRCAKWKDASTCEVFEYRDVDLADAGVREVLRASSFVCKVGSKRFLICKDQPGLCFYSNPCTRKFLGICTKREEIREYIAQSDTEKLKGFGAICFNEDLYPYLEM